MKLTKLILLLLVFPAIIFLGCSKDNDIKTESQTPETSQEFDVVEEIGANGYVGTVAIPDSLYKYTLLFEIEEGNENDTFTIDSSNGDVYISDLTNYQGTDEEIDEYNLVVKVFNELTNDELLKTNLNIKIAINLNGYSTLKQIGYVSEGCEQSFLVGTVVSIDTTVKLDFRFDILRGNQEGVFNLDRISGELTVENPTLIDYETTQQYQLEIVVSNYDNPKDSVLYYVNYYINVLEENYEEKGLIGYYPFDGNTKDYSLSENHAVNYESYETYINGINNQSIEFNGYSNFLVLTNTLDVNITKAFSFWLKPYGHPSDQNNGSIITKYDKDILRCFMINSYSSQSYGEVHDRLGVMYHAGTHYTYGDWVKSNYQDYEGEITEGSEGLWKVSNATTFDLNEWQHCVINLTDDSLAVYINNELTVSKYREFTSYNNTNGVPTYIGNTINGGQGANNHLYGALDELRIYDRSLSREEIASLYTNRK